MAKDAMFSPTIDRHHEAQERRQQLLSSRSAAIKDRVQRYVSQPGTYESEARVHTKSALDQLKQQQGEISARNRQARAFSREWAAAVHPHSPLLTRTIPPTRPTPPGPPHWTPAHLILHRNPTPPPRTSSCLAQFVSPHPSYCAPLLEQFKEQEERKVMEHAHLQELQLQRRTNTRMVRCRPPCNSHPWSWKAS